MNLLEKKMAEHLETFPERRKELLDFQRKTLENDEEIKKSIEVARTHTEPSPKTLLKIEEVRQENTRSNKQVEMKIDSTKKELIDLIMGIEEKMEGVKTANENALLVKKDNDDRVNRVLFGDQDNPGLQDMVKEIHNRAVGKDGFWNQIFFIGKVATTWTVIGVAVTGIYHFLKK